MIILIPARKGSKGLPLKNRKLLQNTLDIIPEDLKSSTYVFSDDFDILKDSKSNGVKTVLRPSNVSKDSTSTLSTIKSFKEIVYNLGMGLSGDELIIVLYLTYPERKWQDVENAIEKFSKFPDSDSLLCKKEIKGSSPFLMLKEEGENHGSQLFYHDLYRRQDYPKCFEISHYICIINSKNINNLNNNLYNRTTVFMETEDVIDVDTQKDLDKLNEQGL